MACGLGGFRARVQMVFGSFLHLQCPDGVCIGWACALWLQRLFYVDSKGDVKELFSLRASAVSRWVFALAGHVLCGSKDRDCFICGFQR